MPTYDYRCKACSHEFELFQSMSDAVKRKCPKCGKNALERLIGTGAALVFKGSGFYQTDYRSESYKNAAKADAAGASPDSKGDSKGQTKPEATPETKAGAKAEAKSEARADSKQEAKSNAKADAKPQSSSPAKVRSDQKPASGRK